MARVLIREAHGGATRIISDAALPYFLNSGWVIIDTQDDSTDASPLYLSKAESDFRYAKVGDVADLSPSGAGFDVVGLLGQSNQVGANSDVDTVRVDVPHPRVWQFGDPASGSAYASKISQAIDPLLHRGPGGVGPGMEFARWYAGAIKPTRQVLLVPCAQVSTGFSTPDGTSGTTNWRVSNIGGTRLYDNAITQITAALAAAGPGANYVGTIWVQGEQDAVNGLSQATYASYLDALIDGIRANVPAATDSWFLVGQMTPEYLATHPAEVPINAAHIDTPRRKVRAAFAYGARGYVSPGTEIHYTAAGQRLNGRSLFRALPIAWANVLGVAPLIPGAVTFTQTGTAVVATWDRPACRVTDYNVRYSTNNGSTWTSLPRAQSIDNTATISGLSSGGILQVQVRAVNEQGISDWGTTATLTLASLPGRVTGLTAGAATYSTQQLTWSAVASATGYLVEYKLSTDSSWSTFGTVSTPSATVTGLSATSSYDYRVSAINGAGTGTASVTATASTAAAPNVAGVNTSLAAAAWSPARRVSSAYTGPLLTVRRSTDNLTMDVGQDGAGNLDSAAMLAWAGSASVYVTKLYDQMLAGHDLTQTTLAAQPRIVNAGVLDTDGGKPCLVFDGADDILTGTPVQMYAAGSATVLGVMRATGATAGRIFMEGSTGGASIQYVPIQPDTTTATFLGQTVFDTASRLASSGAAPAAFDGTQRQMSVVDTGTSWKKYVGGTAITPLAYTRGAANFSTMALGGLLRVTTASNFQAVRVAELVVWKSALSDTDRQTAEANEKAFFGTP